MDLTRIRFEAWIDGAHRDVCALHINRPEGAKGLRGVWFVLESKELDDLVHGRISSLEDGYHKLSVFGESCTFYDFNFPGDDAGDIICPYFRVNIPPAFFRYLQKVARFVWREARKAKAECEARRDYWRGERVDTEIPISTLTRFQATYGRGTGTVDAQFSDRLITDSAVRPQLREKLDYITTIAKGYTRSKWHTVTLRVSNDSDGYFWTTRDNKGRQGLHGGIVNHSRDPQKDDWSIHT
jgi:hypothetical protein